MSNTATEVRRTLSRSCKKPAKVAETTEPKQKRAPARAPPASKAKKPPAKKAKKAKEVEKAKPEEEPEAPAENGEAQDETPSTEDGKKAEDAE